MEKSQGVQKILLSWYDYALFGASLSLSALIGVYFGFVKKQSTANDYLLGGRQMKVLPIAMSLISSTISGVVVLSVPVDIYRFGITYWIGNPMMILSVFMSSYVYIPVFYKLRITSIYEYFQLRFDVRTRLLSSFLFSLCIILYLPIVIYIPALALSQVTGFNTHLITPVVCGICIFYTTVGGLKAVVWTDALQFFIMVAGMIAVFVMGVVVEGGFGNIWSKSVDGRRVHISSDFDLTMRDTIWTGTVGVFFMITGWLGTNQGFIQKCLSLPTYRDVQKALCIFAIGLVSILSICIFTGLIMFARYFDCDPLKSGRINMPDELLPYYIMEVGSSIPGLPGVFIAGLFSAALSTLSAAMNCTAGAVYEDFIKKFTPKNISPERESYILKLLVVIIGVISTSMIYVVEKLGGVLPLAYGLPGVTNGPMLGLFTVGMLLPVVNSTGAFYGGISSLAIMACIVFGSQWYQSQGIISYPPLPLSIDGCMNITSIVSKSVNITNIETNGSEPFWIFRISFFYYYIVAVLVVIVVSVPVSMLTKSKESVVNRDCITPFMHFLLPKEETSPPDYYTVEKALSIVQNESGKE